jgi:hypothetical protein
MRIPCIAGALFALVSGHAPAPAIEISFIVSEAGAANLRGGDSLRYTYFVTGVTLLAHQELDFRFDPDLYGSLTNGLAGPGFDVLLLQPDNPPGAFGDFSVMALVDHPQFPEVLSVDFTFLGSGAPGAQPFFINQYDQSGKFMATIEAGFTVAAIPEPGSLALGGTGLLVGGVLWALRRRFGGTA